MELRESLKFEKFQNLYCCKLNLPRNRTPNRLTESNEIREKKDLGKQISKSFKERLAKKRKQGMQGKLGTNSQKKKATTYK